MQAFKRKTDNVCWSELPAFLFARTTKQIARVNQQMTDDWSVWGCFDIAIGYW